MVKLTATSAYHIKLGKGDEWSEESIKNGRIYFGYREIPHELLNKKDKKEIERVVAAKFDNDTRRINEVRTFYTASESTLWITFYNGSLYYATSKPEVYCEDDTKRKYRETMNGWKHTDVKGHSISEIKLRGDLVAKKYYRMTICKIPGDLLEYLLRIINCETDPLHEQIMDANRQVTKLIQRLNPKDFELLIDMLLLRSGIMRQGPLGATMKDIDCACVHPLTGRVYYIQAKSKTNKKELKKYLDSFSKMNETNPGATYYFFINEEKSKYESLIKEYLSDDFEVELKDSNDMCAVVAELGLVKWVLERT
jgi:hypothetical protein